MTSTNVRALFTPSRPMLAPKAFYFSYFAAMASLVPFLVLFYREVGLSASQIGLLAGLAPVVTLVSAPLWGAVADATQRHRTLMLLAIVGAIAAVTAVSQATSFGQLLALVVAYAFCVAPIMPLADNSVMHMLADRGAEYGKQRVWGAIGWGLAGFVVGVLVERLGIRVSFVAYGLWMGAGLLVVLRLPVSQAPIGVPFWRSLRALVSERRLAVFLAIALVGGLAMGSVHSFLFLYLAELGAGATLMGLSLVAATLSELPVFFYSDRLLRRFGAAGLLRTSLAASVVRLTAYWAMPAAWWVLPINLLHGLTFSALWVAGVTYANAIAPPGMGATLQGLFAGAVMGLGAAAGALIGGVLFDAIGPAAMYGFFAVLVGAALLLFWRFGRTE
jgi:PPP family 3-phenylpropionic acid transporter